MAVDPLLSYEAEVPDCPEFLDVGVIWNLRPFPWYLITALVKREGKLVEEMLMAPTHFHMKQVVRRVAEDFTILSVDYVSPGTTNGTGRWMIEPVLELSELSNASGGKTPRCKVGGDRTYRGYRLEYPEEYGNESVIYCPRNSSS